MKSDFFPPFLSLFSNLVIEFLPYISELVNFSCVPFLFLPICSCFSLFLVIHLARYLLIMLVFSKKQILTLVVLSFKTVFSF